MDTVAQWVQCDQGALQVEDAADRRRVVAERLALAARSYGFDVLGA